MHHRGVTRSLFTGLFLACAAGAAAQDTPMREHNTLTQAERDAGWRLLFDGKTTNGWRGYMRDTIPSGWQVVNGELTRASRARDIITTGKFRNFELTLDWKVAEGGNSGIFYRAIEGPNVIYEIAQEMQLLDDERHRDGRSPLTSSGSNYALYEAPRGVVKPAGQWNTAKIVARGNRIEHWLNGTKLFEFEIGSPDWEARVAKSKFADWQGFGKAPEGHIGLQEHGSMVSFRNIKIRPLPDET